MAFRTFFGFLIILVYCSDATLCVNEETSDSVCRTTLPGPYQVKIWTVPVGEGDATVIQCPTGELSLVDLGKSKYVNPSSGIQSADQFIRFLEMISSTNPDVNRRDWRALAKNIFLSHSDEDHYSFFNKVLEKIDERQNADKKLKIYIGCAEDCYTDALPVEDRLNFRGYELYQPRGGCLKQWQYPNDLILSHGNSCENVDKRTNQPRFCPGTPGNTNDFVGCFWKKQYSNNYNLGGVNLCDNEYWVMQLMAANYGYINEVWDNMGSSAPHTNTTKEKCMQGRNGYCNNQDSLIMKLTPQNHHSPSMLFMGDFDNKPNSAFDTLIDASDNHYRKLPLSEEIPRLATGLQSDVVMVPHHGAESNENSFQKLIKKILPRTPTLAKRGYAIISADLKSVSNDNCNYNHPKCSVMEYVVAQLNRTGGNCQKTLYCGNAGNNQIMSGIFNNYYADNFNIFQTTTGQNGNAIQNNFIVTTLSFPNSGENIGIDGAVNMESCILQ